MSLTAAPAPTGLARSVWKLLKLQARITFNNLSRAKLRRKIGYAILTALVLAVLAGVFIGSWALIRLMRQPEFAQFPLAESLVNQIPVLVFTVAFFGLLATSFGVLLQSLYLAGDMEFLLSAPVSIRAVFIAKLIAAILPDFGLVCLFGLPILLGIGAARGYFAAYYPLVLVALLALAMVVSGLASLLVMAVVRVVPARRVAELLGFLGAVTTFLCSQSGQLVNSMRISPGQASNQLALVSQLDPSWSPLSWAAHGLAQIATGGWLSGSLLLGAYFLVAAGIFYASLVTAERLYYVGWSRVQAGGRRKRAAKTSPDRLRPAVPTAGTPSRKPLLGWMPAQTQAVMAKDARVLTRDLRNMSQVVTPLLFGVIYAFAITRAGPGSPGGGAPENIRQAFRYISGDGSVAISLFVSWGLLSRLALISFSQEGASYWIVKTSPIRPRQILLAKFLTAYLPGLALGLLFLIGISLLQRADLWATLYSLAMLFFSLAGAVGVNLAFGIAGANLHWQNPRGMMRGATGCLASLASLAYMLVIIVVFFAPPIGFVFFGLPEFWGRVIGMTVGIAASLAGALIPTLSILKRIPRIGEE